MFVIISLGAVISNTFLAILYFPVWWYTIGLAKVVRLIVREAQSLAQSFRLKTLFRFLFKPMYGLTDMWSRVLSFGVRIVHFFVLLIVTALYTAVFSILCIVWIVLPPFILYNVFFHLGLIDIPFYA
ncbi:MAG TPA: hypothetical protein VJB65_01170 [Patescibacteria group bacterium]|nr:hypothetical protein [Patescibacteria group bacterium]